MCLSSLGTKKLNKFVKISREKLLALFNEIAGENGIWFDWGEVVAIIILALRLLSLSHLPPGWLAGCLCFKTDSPVRRLEKKERSEFSMMNVLRLENNYLTQEDVR